MSDVDIINPITDKYSNFLDLETMVKPWLFIDPDDTSMDFVLATITNGISVRMQSFIGSPIAPKVYGPDDGIGKFDGGNGLYASYIMLPKTPVLKVIDVTEYWNQTPMTLVEISEPGGSGSPPVTDGYQVNYRTGRLTRILGGIWPRPWMPGSQNVWVTWLAGYNPIPGDIMEVALDWVKESFVKGFQSNVSRGPQIPGSSGGGSPEEAAYKGMPYYVEGVLQTYLQPSIGS